VKQIYAGKKPLYTFSPPAANESALKANHQAVVDVTKDTLTNDPVVLFKEKGFVNALREWVGVGGEFGDMKGGEDLRDLFNAHIRGHPFTRRRRNAQSTRQCRRACSTARRVTS